MCAGKEKTRLVQRLLSAQQRLLDTMQAIREDWSGRPVDASPWSRENHQVKVHKTSAPAQISEVKEK
jgi:hypothetical protein